MPRTTVPRPVAECVICGKPYQQRRPTQVSCSIQCRAKLPHNTGGPRPKAGLASQKCPGCGTEYIPVRENQRACSRACRDALPDRREAQRSYDTVRREHKNALVRVPDEDGPRKEWVKARNLRRNLRWTHGLTVAQYTAKLEEQGGVCAICGQPPNPDGVKAASRLHADHDHVTGRDRDLLCLNCNVAIGHFRDDPDLMQAAADYIKRHRALVAEGKI